MLEEGARRTDSWNTITARVFEEGAYQDPEQQTDVDSQLGFGVQPSITESPEVETDFPDYEPDGPVDSRSHLDGEVIREDVSTENIEITYSITGTSVQGNETQLIESMGVQGLERLLNDSFEDVDVTVESEYDSDYGNTMEVTVQYDSHDTITEGVYSSNEVIRSLDEWLEPSNLE